MGRGLANGFQNDFLRLPNPSALDAELNSTQMHYLRGVVNDAFELIRSSPVTSHVNQEKMMGICNVLKLFRTPRQIRIS